MDYKKVMIDFYCPKFRPVGSRRHHPTAIGPTERRPGYEVGSASPGIWPVAASVAAARHFFEQG